MLIRPYTPADLDALRALHSAQNLPYAFPDLANPLFLTKIVAEDNNVAENDGGGCAHIECAAPACRQAGPAACNEKGRITAAVLLRLTAEAYLLMDPHHGTPRDRLRTILALHEAARADARQRGLDDAHAWLPPAVARAFGRRLERLGWFREPWPCFSRSSGT
jgi:hypothetical protein